MHSRCTVCWPKTQKSYLPWIQHPLSINKKFVFVFPFWQVHNGEKIAMTEITRQTLIRHHFQLQSLQLVSEKLNKKIDILDTHYTAKQQYGLLQYLFMWS